MTGARVVALALALAACADPSKDIVEERRTLWFAGKKAADVLESVRAPKKGGLVVDRGVRLVDAAPKDSIQLVANLDARGFLDAARYIRVGPSGRRLVDLRRGASGKHELFTAVGGGTIELPARPVVAIELVRRVAPTALPADVVFVDVASADWVLGSLDAQGRPRDARGAPLSFGAFVETPADAPAPAWTGPPIAPPIDAPPRPPWRLKLVGLDGVQLHLDGPGQRGEADGATPVVVVDPAIVDAAPPQAHHFHVAPFIESRAPPVVTFARSVAPELSAPDAARAIAQAVFPMVDAKKKLPPSAFTMLESGGDCDGAAALVVASLRALGHAARPVVGWRVVDGALRPHAWAEVSTPAGWLPVDATIPAVGPLPTHVRLFEGLPSALNMGRVLGVAAPVVVAPATTP